MFVRIATSVVALGVFALILLAPPIVFNIALFIVILIMAQEYCFAAKADLAMKITSALSVLMVLILPLVGRSYGASLCVMAVIFTILFHAALIVAEHGKRGYKDILSCAFMTLYVTLSMSCVWFARERYGTAAMLIIFICAWSTDTFAYFTGYFFGKRKLIPNVSPNKTIAGAIGGVVGAIVVLAVYPQILKLFDIVLAMPWTVGAAIGLVGGICSQVGDLAASAIKRDEGIKDYGNIFPGHGGFMDRFDSVIFIAPAVLAVMWILLDLI